MILPFDYIGFKRFDADIEAMETIHPFCPQVASLYQRWLGKRLFSDKRLKPM
jgi:acetone carboxylase gamma subunit